MNILDMLYVMAARAFYGWALREINPLHPDLPGLLLRQHDLDDRARKLFKRSAAAVRHG